MDTTINTGWTPDVTPKPATAAQIRALMVDLQGKTALPERDDALAAADNLLDCLSQYRAALEKHEAEAEAAEARADVQERTDLYEMGMGR